ncbi:hypothetical protein [Stenotrophomonas phage RAS14]
MTTRVLKANPTQRKNIAKLVSYLTQQLAAKDKTYNHSNVAACTIGFAIKSGLFEPLNRYSISTGRFGEPNVHHAGRNPFTTAVVSEVIMKGLFGSDYVNEIVFPGRRGVDSDFQPFGKKGLSALRYVIKHITKVYELDAPAPAGVVAAKVEADNIRAKVTARVAELEELVKACKVVYKHSPLDTVKQTKDAAATELLILKNLLEK